MNSVHDMGGMDGFGPVRPEPDEPVFHAPWEGRVQALSRALAPVGMGTIDHSRAMMEAMDPVEYLSVSYMKRRFLGIERRLLAKGLVTAEELAAGHSLRPGKSVKAFSTADVPKMRRGEFSRPASAPARFAVGDRVRTRNMNPTTHTRLPRYARGKAGTIAAVRGCHVFPDSVATDQGENPQWLYTVVFAGRELWGDDTDPSVQVSIEAFEPYLLPA